MVAHTWDPTLYLTYADDRGRPFVELLARIGALGLHAPEGGSLTFAVTDAGGRLLATTTVAELLRVAKKGCPGLRLRQWARSLDSSHVLRGCAKL